MRSQGYRRASPALFRPAAPGAGPAPPMRHHRGMTSAAEISSLSSTLAELHDRVTALAESALSSGDEDMAHELIAVERALGGALRRLRRFGQGRSSRR